MDTKDFSERFLYHIWDAGHITGEFQTKSGKALKIISCGRFSSSAGPDFREAVVMIDNELLRGDVEIHKSTYDWKAHGHQEDANYCNLVLHVVYRHNMKPDYTIDKEGNRVEIFELRDYLDDDILRIFNGYKENPDIPTEKFCTFFAGEQAELLQPLLKRYGLLRLEEKKKRFAAEQYFAGFNQLAYRGILEALGYSKNKYQMLQLADMIEYPDLRNFAERGMTLQEMIAIWMGSSGLIDTLPSTFPPEFILKWKELYARQKYCDKRLDIKWHLFRLRPVNHPAIRLLQISEVVYNSLSRSLFNDFQKLFSFPAGQIKMKDFYQRLYSMFLATSEFLPERYKMGKTRLDVIFINIILPLVLLYAENSEYKELQKAVKWIYENYHSLPENHLIRSMRQYMDDSQAKSLRSKAIYQQALLHIYNSFCRYHTCRECAEHKKQIKKDR